MLEWIERMNKKFKFYVDMDLMWRFATFHYEIPQALLEYVQ